MLRMLNACPFLFSAPRPPLKHQVPCFLNDSCSPICLPSVDAPGPLTLGNAAAVRNAGHMELLSELAAEFALIPDNRPAEAYVIGAEHKNRYCDVLPNESTRFRMRAFNGLASGYVPELFDVLGTAEGTARPEPYINANNIRVSGDAEVGRNGVVDL